MTRVINCITHVLPYGDYEQLGRTVGADGPHAGEKCIVILDSRDEDGYIPRGIRGISQDGAWLVLEVADNINSKPKVAEDEKRPEGDCDVNRELGDVYRGDNASRFALERRACFESIASIL